MTLTDLAKLIQSQLDPSISVEVVLQPDNILHIIQRKLIKEYEE